jgi:hypothetical protein
MKKKIKIIRTLFSKGEYSTAILFSLWLIKIQKENMFMDKDFGKDGVFSFTFNAYNPLVWVLVIFNGIFSIISFIINFLTGWIDEFYMKYYNFQIKIIDKIDNESTEKK